MMKPDVILWDWDNTLINSRPVAEKALRRLGDETNVPITDADVTEVIGGHLVDFWFRHYGENPIPMVERFLDFYRTYRSQALLFPQSKAILDWVRAQGIPQIVVSNKDEDIVCAEAERFSLSSYFYRIIGTIDHGAAKPSQAYAERALGSIRPRHILMIGDGESDMAFARMLGATGILVRPMSEAISFSYDYRVPNLDACLQLLQKEVPT